MKSFHEQAEPPKKRGRSLFSRMLLGYLSLSLCLIALAGGLSSLLLRTYIAEEYLKNLREQAQIAADILSRRQDVMSPDILRDMEELTGVHAVWFNEDYVAHMLKPRLSDDEGADAFERIALTTPEDKSLIAYLLQEPIGQTTITGMDLLGDRAMLAGVPLTGGRGGVLLYRWVHSLRRLTQATALAIFIAMVLAGLFSLLLALVISRRVSRPLSDLTRSARYIAEGHYGEQVEVPPQDEVGALAESLNDMSSHLSRTIFDLQNEKTKLEQIIADIGEGIVAMNREGEIIHRNNAALELLEIGRCQKLGDMHRRHLLDMLAAAMNDRERAETRWVSESGRTIRARVWPILCGKGEIIGAVGLLSDVSELERLEQLRRDYVANVSHELRTPLTGIQGMVEPLMDGCIETEEERMDCYRVIYQETLRLKKLIGDMLDMSRLQSGAAAIEMEPMDVTGVMEGAVRRMREQAANCGVDLRVEDGQAPMPMVTASEDRVMQVLIILIDNALSFTPAGGRVTLYARRTCERVFVGVRDTGSGIDPADMPYIWERFYKADKSRMRTTGTGLGLSIAKLLCERMNGGITASSEPGRGATFEFSLNISRKPAADFVVPS